MTEQATKTDIKNSANSNLETNPWMKGFKVMPRQRVEGESSQIDSEAVRKRRAVEESIEAKKQLAEWGIM